jgi:ribose/xylose/arabinose/galactoside ABC-type transport system permease subunit
MTQTTNQPTPRTATGTAAAGTLDYKTPSPGGGEPSRRRWVSALNAVGPFIGLLLVYGFFAFFGPSSFATKATLMTMAEQTVIVGIAALGATAVIIAGGIDLSVGSMVALVTVATGLALQQGWSATTATAVGIGAGLVCGLVNGALVSLLRVGPFIVTLGTLLIFRGAAKGFAHEQTVNPDELGFLGNLLGRLSKDRAWMIVSPGVWTFLLLAVLTAILLRYTRLGRHFFAIGSNEQTARLCGIAINRVKVIVYALAGMLTGVAGVMQFSRLNQGDPTVANGLELNVIAAVVIGGGSLNGGEGTVLGTLIGALIMTVIKAGCDQMGLSNWVQEIVTGVIIVIAVAVDRLRHRKGA